jgi:putative phosphoesterase
MDEVPAPTRILVVSDTHVSTAAALPTALFELAGAVDHVIHAGDHSSADVVAVLATFAPVTAVHGNVEQAEVVERLPLQATVELGGVRIGVVHDAGARAGRHERLERRFPGCGVVVYGHSHEPEVARSAAGTLVINPGSPTQRRRAPTHTVAMLEVAGGVAEATLVHLD